MTSHENQQYGPLNLNEIIFSGKNIMRENRLYVIHLFREIVEWA